MLFDLRSRRRRGVVRVIYLFLAVVMVAGLVLVGVGTGSNQGGLLNAFTNNGTGGGGSQLADQTLNQALKAVKKNPSAANWSSLIQARWSVAGSGSNYNSTTGAYSASGKKQLQLGADAWQHYLTVTKDKPSPDTTILAARIYQTLSQWSNAAVAWNYAAQYYASQSGPASQALKPYLCLSLSAYAASQTTKGQLAADQALKLTPKLQRLTLKSTLDSAKASASTAQQTLIAEC
jgi:hypothetical protein